MEVATLSHVIILIQIDHGLMLARALRPQRLLAVALIQ